MPKLLIFNEGERPREVELRAHNTLGRHPSQTVQLLDRLISKEHAEIVRRGAGFWVRDLQSRNGTFVNKRLISAETPLVHGDEVVLGSTRVVFSETTGEQDPYLNRVTIAPKPALGSVHSAQAAVVREFLPERQIGDVAELRRDYERLRMAYELQQSLSLELKLEPLLDKIFDYLFSTLLVDRGVILLVDENGKPEPRRVRRRQMQSQVQDDEISISQTILNQVMVEKKGLLSSDAQIDSRFSGAQSIILQGIRSTMCVPLLARDRLVGVIHLDNLLTTGAFTEKDLHLIQVLASQAAMAIENIRLVKQVETEALTRQNFERLLSPNLVEKVVSGELRIEKGGELRPVTVLFADVRGFTEMSENQPAPEIVHMLNEYFEAMVEVIFQFDGTLDKFMGDGLMALWGAPVTHQGDAANAAKAAVRMKNVLRELNEQRVSEGQIPLQVGIGMDTGEIVAGYMGSSRTMSYTVVGASVNRAARLCSAAGPDEILVSESTWQQVKDVVQYEKRAAQKLKGIRQPVACYAVLGVVS